MRMNPVFAANAFRPITKAVLMALACTPFYLQAQETQSDDKKLEVIEVTAQKRVQNIMKVPLTVGTVSASTLEESAAILLSDVDKFIPGFDFSDSSMTQAGVTMRGISSPNISVGGDPSSATFYDDVYMPRAAQNVLFSDLERVEVLKGPQGTLFGRNAAMGVVNIVPNKPTDEFTGFAKMSLGTDNLKRWEGMVNVPLTDNLFMRGNFLINTQDGFVENVAETSWKDTRGWDLGERDHRAGRLSLLWNASNRTNVQIAYERDNLEQAPPMAIGTSIYAYNQGQDVFASKVENDVRNGVESRDMYGLTLKVNHTFNDEWSAKYVLSYRDWETVNREDEDGTADITRYFDTSNNEDSNIMYTELQLSYVNDRINAVTGFSYSKEDVSQRTELNMTTDTVARLVTGELNGQVRGMIAQELAGAIGGDSDELAAAVFGPGVTFADAVNMQFNQLGFPMDHMWDANAWASALDALGVGGPLMAAIGFPNSPLTGPIVTALGDLTYDLVSQELGEPMIFGPSYSGMMWQENVYNTGDFTNWGLYADVDYALTDKWHVIGGLRYSHDEKDFTWYISEPSFTAVRPGVSTLLFPQVNLAASDSWSKVTGRLVTSYQLDNDQMLFASYSTGYKSGGFDSLVPVDMSMGQSAFAPEDSSNIEIGYKATLWDSLRANVSFYMTELDNFQVTKDSKAPGSTTSIPTIINENRAIDGVEIDLRWYASSSLQLGMVTEIRTTDIDTPSFYNAEGDLVDAESRSTDAATNYTLILDWSPDSDLGIVNVHMDYVFVDNTRADEVGIEAFKLAVPEYFWDRKSLDTRVSWSNFEETIEVGLWGRNITDERYVESLGGLTAGTLGTPFARINRGREVGIDIKVEF